MAPAGPGQVPGPARGTVTDRDRALAVTRIEIPVPLSKSFSELRPTVTVRVKIIITFGPALRDLRLDGGPRSRPPESDVPVAGQAAGPGRRGLARAAAAPAAGRHAFLSTMVRIGISYGGG